MDIALLFRNDRPIRSDIEMDGYDLRTNKDLESAVIISLFTDRRANDDDTYLSDDRRGWWADTFMIPINYKIGSRLWLLYREKQTTEVLNRAHQYVTESMQWLIDDKIAQAVRVEVEWVSIGVLGIRIEILRPQGTEAFKYDYAWNEL